MTCASYATRGAAIADAGVNIPSTCNPELSSVARFKPGVGQVIATHASHTARISSVLFAAFLLIYRLFFFFFFTRAVFKEREVCHD